MEGKVQEVEIGVKFTSQYTEVVQGDRCANDEINFRWNINDQKLVLGTGKVNFYQSLEQKYPECPIICLVDSNQTDFHELDMRENQYIKLAIDSDSAGLIDSQYTVAL